MRRERTSRRRFFETTIAGAASAVAAGTSAAKPRVERDEDPDRRRLARIAARYGSELGRIERVGS